jgi:hypothetical protein
MLSSAREICPEKFPGDKQRLYVGEWAEEFQPFYTVQVLRFGADSIGINGKVEHVEEYGGYLIECLSHVRSLPVYPFA